MDSKLKRTAVSMAVAIVALVVLVVYGMNRDQKPVRKDQGTGANKPTQEEVKTPPVKKENGQIGDDLKAFLKDEFFFDSEDAWQFDSTKYDIHKLTLRATSVEKDMRLKILDISGKPVVGESFLVKLENGEEYRDLDQDGVIYIGDLKPGEYAVQLMPAEGYYVPKEATRVRVKEQVEYVAIDDISLLVKNEDEIDGAEDTRIKSAEKDSDKSEITKLQASGSKNKIGVDVSGKNGEIDWDQVKKTGVDFGIIRLGYRGSVTGALIKDAYFEKNMRGAKSAGIETGVYFFTQAVNEVEAVEEASMVLDELRSYRIDYPVFLVVDDSNQNGRVNGLNAKTRTNVCLAFCQTIENAGYTVGIYSSRNWLGNSLDVDKLDQYVIWMADYREIPLYQGYYQMWQYTSKAKVKGIDGEVALNIYYN